MGDDIKYILSDKVGTHDDYDSDYSIDDIIGSVFGSGIISRKHDFIKSENRRKDSKDDD